MRWTRFDDPQHGLRVDGVIGSGATALVLAVYHPGLDRRVALKLLRPALRGQPALVRRFAHEAHVGAQLRSRHATQVLDVSGLTSPAPCFAMEYLEGRDLAQELARTGPLPPDRAVALVLQACDVLGEAHALGIVHRDVKPANLFVTRDSRGAPLLKLLDFGSCRMRGADAAVAVGTPRYMAPEQLRSARAADPRSDVWSLGVVLHELVSGRPPFAGAVPRTIPDGIAAVIAGCLAAQPAARYACARDVARDLRRLAAPRV